MKSLRNDFATPNQQEEAFYDLFEDYDLIEASFAQQYGIRLRVEDDMQWTEFISLLSGLNGETPLGRVVGIRAEKNIETIKKFSKEERRIYNEWRQRRGKDASKMSKEDFDKAMKNLEEVFSNIANVKK